MLIKCSATTVAMFFLLVAVPAQTTPTADDDMALRRRIQKQFLLNHSDGRLREIDLAAPRVLLRFKIAAWLWDGEADDFDRAEDLATGAIDDLYKNRSEIPPVYFSALSSGLFTLLERKSPKTARVLKNRYDLTESEQAGIEDQLIREAGNDKTAVDIAIRSLFSGSTLDSQLPVLLHILKKRKSIEIIRLLDAIISLEERNPGRLDLGTLTSVSPYFAELNVQRRSAERFARIIVRRVQITSQSPFADFDAWLEVLNLNSNMINQRVPALVSEVEVLRVVLNSRISQRSRLERERNDRINNSTDRLEALVKEAEGAQDSTVKYDLFRRAAKLASEKGLFRRSADLAVEFGGVDISSVRILAVTQRMEFGQLLESVTKQALNSGDDASALYAIERHKDDDRKVAGYLEVLDFFIAKTDLESARDMIRIVSQAISIVESPARRAILCFRLIPKVRGVDPRIVFDINMLASRSLNSIPSLEVEDKPGTEAFNRYATEIMDINWNLFPMLLGYAKEDKFAASDLVSRIEKKEIRALADFALGVTALDELAVRPSVTAVQKG